MRVLDKVKELLEEYKSAVYLEELDNIDSPIEKMMYIALITFNHHQKRGDPVSMNNFYIDLQPNVRLGDKKYRPDFKLTMMQVIKVEGEYIARAFECYVECDGHDYHERTKEQAKNDRSKDRAFTSAGMHLLRFTGSEIYNDSNRCVLDIFKFMTKNLEELSFKNISGGEIN